MEKLGNYEVGIYVFSRVVAGVTTISAGDKGLAAGSRST